jgi:hypothetical protein
MYFVTAGTNRRLVFVVVVRVFCFVTSSVMLRLPYFGLGRVTITASELQNEMATLFFHEYTTKTILEVENKNYDK